MNYDQRKHNRDVEILRRVKGKIKVYNSLGYMTRTQKLKHMALITHRSELKAKLNGNQKQVA